MKLESEITFGSQLSTIIKFKPFKEKPLNFFFREIAVLNFFLNLLLKKIILLNKWQSKTAKKYIFEQLWAKVVESFHVNWISINLLPKKLADKVRWYDR